MDFNEPLERRDVNSKRRDVVKPTLFHVAMLPRTSRRRLVPRFVTSRRCPVLRPRTIHFCSSPRTHHYRNPSPLAHLSSPDLPELSVTPAGGSYIALRPSLSTPQSPSLTGPLSTPHSPSTHVALITLVFSTRSRGLIGSHLGSH